MLRIPRTTLDSKIRKLGINRYSFKRRESGLAVIK
jgi:hypothetical protein